MEFCIMQHLLWASKRGLDHSTAAAQQAAGRACADDRKVLQCRRIIRGREERADHLGGPATPEQEGPGDEAHERCKLLAYEQSRIYREAGCETMA